MTTAAPAVPTGDGPDLGGLWVPLVTPFDERDRVDLPALVRLAQRVLDDGAHGIVALGTTGEATALDESEQVAVVDACAGVCTAARRPLLVGAGSGSTRRTIEAVRRLGAVAGVSAALVVVPPYVRPSPAGVLRHFRAVAGAAPVPLVAYHIPYRTGCHLTAEHLLELAAIDGVVGLKQSVGALDVDTLELLRSAPDGFAVLAGDDAVIAPAILLGAAGAIAAAAHLCTAAFVALVDAARAGDAPTARAVAAALLPVVVAGAAEPSPALWKAALHRAGELAVAAVRPPLVDGSPAATAALLDAVAFAGRTLAASSA